MMTKRALLALSGLVLVLAGCASDQQLLANDQTNAVQAAVRRGQFEMSCPGATGTMLSNTCFSPCSGMASNVPNIRLAFRDAARNPLTSLFARWDQPVALRCPDETRPSHSKLSLGSCGG